MRKLLIGLAILFLAPTAGAQPKQRIEKAADLPRFSYVLDGTAEQVVRDPHRFAAFAAQLRTDTESVLARYDIADKAMRRDLLNLLLLLDLLDGRDAAVLERIEQIRALQDKPAEKLLTGLQARAVVEARKSTGSGQGEAYRAAVARNVAAALQPLPYRTIANEIKEAKARTELMGEGRTIGYLNEVLQPTVAKTGALSSELAPGLVNARVALQIRLPLKETMVQSYGDYLAAHHVEKPDIWAARNVELAAGAARAPVVIGVWDSGVDPAVYAAQVLRDAGGQPLAIGFDRYADPRNTPLQELTAAQEARLPAMQSRSKGFSDLRSNVDSPEAGQVKRWLSSLSSAEYKPAIEELMLAGNYHHGTHVAGIALAGHPDARLLIARIEFGATLLPDPCPSRALAEKDARNFAPVVDFLKRHGARVVNMSWSIGVADVGDALEKCGIGKSPEERKALAREYFGIARGALERALASAPEILFVAAAGNSDQDASFAEDAPADIVLPNLLTVGAVDKAGDEASFTSYGPTVKAHANGYQVESFLPGGARMAMSGTSMAAPQVANLAAKMLAVNPRLSPPQLISIIVATADKTADGRRVLINPKLAVERARRLAG